MGNSPLLDAGQESKRSPPSLGEYCYFVWRECKKFSLNQRAPES